ncbi:DUF998 domain-containing protein, partial [Candidatus Bathyarchaeota archaeon]
MNERNYAFLGLAAPLIAIFFIAVSIALSPWFNWGTDALSDLGHSGNSAVAPLFNFGLLLSGFLIIVFAVKSFRTYAKYTSYFLTLVGLALQLVATFNEVYKPLHFQVSVLFFVSLGFVSISYFIEKRSSLAVAALIIGAVSWIMYGLEIYSSGIAVPEAVSSMATVTWVMLAAFKIYLN